MCGGALVGYGESMSYTPKGKPKIPETAQAVEDEAQATPGFLQRVRISLLTQLLRTRFDIL